MFFQLQRQTYLSTPTLEMEDVHTMATQQITAYLYSKNKAVSLKMLVTVLLQSSNISLPPQINNFIYNTPS